MNKKNESLQADTSLRASDLPSGKMKEVRVKLMQIPLVPPKEQRLGPRLPVPVVPEGQDEEDPKPSPPVELKKCK